MQRLLNETQQIGPGRFMWANIAMVAIVSALLFRLWYVQIYRGDYYRQISENNRIQYIEVPAARGIVYDRNGQSVLGNRPYFDLVYVPQFVKDTDTTFKILSRLLHVPAPVFQRRLNMAKGLPKYLPVSLKRNLSLHEVAVIESNKIFLPGIDVAQAPRRDYKASTPSHVVGYLGEISKKELTRQNDENPDNPYRAGDLIGKQGLEARWERYLRGDRGNRLIQVDAFGRQVDSLERASLNLPEVPAVPGSDLILTIDMELQVIAQDAFKGKNGAVVALDPRSGEILAMVSEPGYDPNLYQTGMSADKYRSLVANPFKPFLDKTTGGIFMPGSTWKAVVAVAGLEEGVINANKTVFCPGYYTLGDKTMKCHAHQGHGMVNLRKALMKSCDVYFYNLGVELGVDRIAKYANELGMGQKLGVNLNMELPGLVPTTAWKRLTSRVPWAAGETPSVAIGQGAVQTTPMQMAALYAEIGMEGKLFRPHLVRRIVNHVGETVLTEEPELIRTAKIRPETWRLVKEGLTAVVMDQEGTGKNARVEGQVVAGKTGSVQVVSLSRNSGKGQKDVSMQWREHAMFTAFSPAENPEIALAIVSEHDVVGGGGASAAPVAGKILNAFWRLKAERARLAQAAQTSKAEERDVKRN